ncbi:hypothetical protein UFOVP679_35 [uncultured Caudovirales phage]|uniref:Uncharacterized protein n=1 Tax=uncultured Caudovirales phage TaxID=2100421 RepID=A0A6J5NJJ1_9CAUD|nr:hypothetical protein UFOVP679_35 [uncultured Caudovirales phage]
MKLPPWMNLDWLFGVLPEPKTHWFFDQARFERESRIGAIRIRQSKLAEEIRTAVKQKKAASHLYAEQRNLTTERMRLEAGQ